MSAWILRCTVADADRPGLLARVTALFAARGTSLGEVLAVRTAAGPRLLLRVAASESAIGYLRRRLARDPLIATVSAEADGGGELWSYLTASD